MKPSFARRLATDDAVYSPFVVSFRIAMSTLSAVLMIGLSIWAYGKGQWLWVWVIGALPWWLSDLYKLWRYGWRGESLLHIVNGCMRIAKTMNLMGKVREMDLNGLVKLTGYGPLGTRHQQLDYADGRCIDVDFSWRRRDGAIVVDLLRRYLGDWAEVVVKQPPCWMSEVRGEYDANTED